VFDTVQECIYNIHSYKFSIIIDVIILGTVTGHIPQIGAVAKASFVFWRSSIRISLGTPVILPEVTCSIPQSLQMNI
jgi:hypothetical protein